MSVPAKKQTETAVAPTSESAALISMLERAARDPSVDIVKMERLFEMAERVRTREAEAAFNAAMSAAQAELVPVAKNAKNKQTGSDYANLAAIAALAMPVIYKHGFGAICSEFESKKPDHIGVACEVTHSGGHSKRYEFNIPTDGTGMKGNPNKTATHAYGSTLSYGERYAKCKVFGIATKDDDGNAAGGIQRERITEKQASELKALMEKAGLVDQIICEHFKVESIADLTPSEFQTATNKCKATIKFRNS